MGGGKSLRRQWSAEEIEKKLDELEKKEEKPKSQKSLDDLLK